MPLSPREIPFQQQRLEAMQESFDQFARGEDLSELFAMLIEPAELRDRSRDALRMYRFAAELRFRSIVAPPVLFSEESLAFDICQREHTTILDHLRTALEMAYDRARRTESFDPWRLAILRDAGEALRHLDQQTVELEQSRSAFARRTVEEHLSGIGRANQSDRFRETGGACLLVLSRYVRNPEAVRPVPRIPAERHLVTGQRAAMAKTYGEAFCDEIANIVLCAAHRELYDPHRRIGDQIALRATMVQWQGRPETRRGHAYVSFGLPYHPGSVAVDGWTAEPTVTSTLNHSVEQSHAFRFKDLAPADGRDYEREARDSYLNHAWLAAHPKPDLPRAASVAETAVLASPAVRDVYQVRHAYHDRRDDPRAGRALTIEALLTPGRDQLRGEPVVPPPPTATAAGGSPVPGFLDVPVPLPPTPKDTNQGLAQVLAYLDRRVRPAAPAEATLSPPDDFALSADVLARLRRHTSAPRPAPRR
ncbi:hypothetical protein ACN28G_20835 [Micromonospora sp. WMMA1923]|uniref:hypothetical protein n=1 Tax=Micromonospora sp. WMMA1923 TaxID=3404125 RepID=UPI003B948CB4